MPRPWSAGTVVPVLFTAGQAERRRQGIDGRHRQVLPLPAGHAARQAGPRRRRSPTPPRSPSTCRPGQAVRRPGVQDHRRPVRGQAGVDPHPPGHGLPETTFRAPRRARRASRSATCSRFRARTRRRSRRRSPATSSPWPRSRTSSAGDVLHAGGQADVPRHAAGAHARCTRLAVDAQEPRRRAEDLRGPQQADRRGPHLPRQPRQPDQRDRHQRHGRPAPADDAGRR